MTILIPGIIQVTGNHDTGKTTFALECGADPKRICFFDSDVKGRATVEQLRTDGIEFGAYHDLNALADKKREMDFFTGCLELIDKIKPNQYDAIIWDTWERFGKCFHPAVVSEPATFKQYWSRSGKIKGAEQWQEAQQYEARLLNHLGQLARSVIVVSHLKDDYLNNAKTGKKKPASSRTLNRVPRFRIWLRHNPGSPVPIGLVLKRVDKKVVVDGALRTVSQLPRKIVPRAQDQSLWDTIAWYFENPVGLREPLPEEVPNEFELSILDGTLTVEQKHTLHLMLKAGAVEAEEEEDAEVSAPTTWQELLTMSGKGLGDLGGIEGAEGMSVEEIEEKWGEWRDG